jgi:hypothetical protein
MIAFRLFLVARLRSTAAEGVKVRSDIFSLPSVTPSTVCCFFACLLAAMDRNVGRAMGD